MVRFGSLYLTKKGEMSTDDMVRTRKWIHPLERFDECNRGGIPPFVSDRLPPILQNDDTCKLEKQAIPNFSVVARFALQKKDPGCWATNKNKHKHKISPISALAGSGALPRLRFMIPLGQDGLFLVLIARQAQLWRSHHERR